jgi:exodeoxyribonuclease VII small subunit
VTDPQQAAIPTDDAINAMSFEQALAQLTQLVERLESGQLSLEDSVAAFETGVKLSRRCEALLDSAEQRLQILNDAAAE